jgi:hypothetical protein
MSRNHGIFIKSLEEIAEILGIKDLLTTKRLWVRHSRNQSEPPYEISSIKNFRTRLAITDSKVKGRQILCPKVCIEWHHGGHYEPVLWGEAEWVESWTDTAEYFLADCYKTWAEARGGWPLVGDKIQVKTKDGLLKTTVTDIQDGMAILPSGQKVCPVDIVSPKQMSK